MDTNLRTTRELFERDARFRMMAHSVAAEVRAGFGEIGPEDAERDANEMALQAAALMLKRIYDEDTELRYLRLECERLRDLVIKTGNMIPVHPLIVATADAIRASG